MSELFAQLDDNSLTAVLEGGVLQVDSDLSAIHKNQSGEISTITEKTSLDDNDLFLIEDSGASNAKKKVKKSTLQSNLSVETDPIFTASPAFSLTTLNIANLHAPGSDDQDLSGYSLTSHNHNLNDLTEKSYNSLTDKPTIPDKLSDLSEDSTHRVITDVERALWNAKQAALSLTLTSLATGFSISGGATPKTLIVTDMSTLSGLNTGDQDLSGLALKNNVLELNNTTPFTPDADYEPATKKYVDDNSGGSLAWGNITGDLSSQTDLHNALNAKQDTLVSASNIKTINSESILGGGDLVVTGVSVDLTSITTDLKHTPIGNSFLATQLSYNPVDTNYALDIQGIGQSKNGVYISANETIIKDDLGNPIINFSNTGGTDALEITADSLKVTTDDILASQFLKTDGSNKLITVDLSSTFADYSHDHLGVYEPVDATILRSADIGTTVQAHDSTILVDADIGVSVQGYDSTILVDADIGVLVAAEGHDHSGTYEPADATILKDADIGVSVQAYDADTSKTDAIESITALKTFDKDKIAMKGTSTGVTTISTANTSASDYTVTLQPVTGTLALTSDLPVITKTLTVENPTSSEDISIFYTDIAVTVTKITAVLVGSSTPSVTWTIRHSTDRSATGNEVVTSGTTTTSISTGSVVTSFNDATIPADSFIWFETTAKSGTVTQISVTIEYTED